MIQAILEYIIWLRNEEVCFNVWTWHSLYGLRKKIMQRNAFLIKITIIASSKFHNDIYRVAQKSKPISSIIIKSY